MDGEAHGSRGTHNQPSANAARAHAHSRATPCLLPLTVRQVLCSYALHLLETEALGATLRALARGALRGSRAPVLLSKVIHPPLSTTP